jgi:septal ring factor EnvC (AmiA/AmiB activator)
MKRSISILTAVLLMFTITIQAQMRMSHEERVKQYQERLKLTDKQTKSIDTILTKMEDKMKSMNTEDRSQRREAFMKIMDETNKQIEKVLTPTQKDEFNKMLEERRNRMKNMMGGGQNQ